MAFLTDLQLMDVEGRKMFMSIRRKLDQMKHEEGIFGTYGFYLRIDKEGLYRVFRIPLSESEIKEGGFASSLADEFIRERYERQVEKESNQNP